MEMRRKIGKRKFRKTIFILTQGTVTEYKYFSILRNHLKLKSVNVKVAHRHVTNALHFVRKAIRAYSSEIKDYDEFWLVFDKDETNESDLNEAIRLATKNRIKCAYSIQAFEIWLIHHFKKYYAPLDRNLYEKELTKLLGYKYDKSKEMAEKIIRDLITKIDKAIINSENSYNRFDHKNPAIEESSTTVFMLVKSIKNANQY